MIFGYLDPGSGSLILQAVIGGLTGIGVAYKAYRARRGLGKVDPDSEHDDDEENAGDAALPAES
ncbi:MAG TPA: hypothetical protein VJ950_10195 [Acidimicrobiia bacterium]|jgi:hypothetical protein|nr:hypothetical protein [Acidimicrobiia bacterium]